MKICTKDDLEFSDDRRFCSKCGAVLVEDFGITTLRMPKINTKQAEFVELNEDLTFKLSIRNQTYKLSMDEIKILASEVSANVEIADLQRAGIAVGRC